MPDEVTESITVGAPPAEVYRAVSDVRAMARFSPECVAVWVLSERAGTADRFVGFNQRGPFVWFTTCKVVTAEPGQEFTFEVSALGLPVSRWSYQLAAVPGGTEVTESWQDRRASGARILGRMFTGRTAGDRPAINREGMRTTLARLKSELEAG